MADTINTGTMLIEQGTLLPESLRFEGEPWTSFYRAGEMIRELRKALENEASTRAKAPERAEDHCRDAEEPRGERMTTGVPTIVPPLLSDATGY